MLFKPALISLLITTVFGTGCILGHRFGGPTTLLNTEPIVLSGSQSLTIVDSHYVQHNSIVLKDDAALIIRGSFFEHRHDYSFQYHLKAYDNASVIIENSEVSSSEWLNWHFEGNTSLVLQNVNNQGSAIWHVFQASASAKVTKVDKFLATMVDNAVFDVEQTQATFIEFVYPVGATVDESFPQVMNVYTFPNKSDSGIKTRLTIKNSKALSWGITVNPESDVTIRDTHSLVVTFNIGAPFRNVTAEFSNLFVQYHDDKTWEIGRPDTRLRLINTKTERWSPIAAVNNTLIVKNSEIADNAFSFGDAKVVYENCMIAFLHANDQVHMRIKDSVVEGDVVATGNSVIELIDTRVDGKMVEKDNGRIIVVREDS